MLLARSFLDGPGITLKGFQFGLEAPGFHFRFADFLLELGFLPFEAKTLHNPPIPEQHKGDQGNADRQYGHKPFVPEKAEDLPGIEPAFFLSVEEVVHG
jgi:hypothetical protein